MCRVELLDLKHLLIEAAQRVPPFLATLASEQEEFLKVGGDPGCSYCGGLGHRITACPKLEAMNHKKSSAVGFVVVGTWYMSKEHTHGQ